MRTFVRYNPLGALSVRTVVMMALMFGFIGVSWSGPLSSRHETQIQITETTQKVSDASPQQPGTEQFPLYVKTITQPSTTEDAAQPKPV